jgi:DNA polymerase-3 subunit epsilon
MQLNLERPIVFFDLETTGINVGQDHIVQISMYKVNPSGVCRTATYYIRPVDAEGNTVHIPEQTTQIHGITDADVADKPTFRELAPVIAEFIGESDLAGYNSNKFDVPMLVEEFLRAKYPFDIRKRFLVDVQNIFHKMEQRTLKAAYRFYCNKELENAHSADADTMATYEVLLAQLDRYKDAEYVDSDGTVSKPIVNDIEELSRFSTVLQWADLVGHIGYDKQHREVFNFGKHKGKLVEEVFTEEPSYYDWMMKSEFPLSTKDCITKIWRHIREKKKLDALMRRFNVRD